MERRSFLKLFSLAGTLIIPGVAPAVIRNAMPVRVIGTYDKIVVPLYGGIIQVGWFRDTIDVTTFNSDHREYASGVYNYYRQFIDGRFESITSQEYFESLPLVGK